MVTMDDKTANEIRKDIASIHVTNARIEGRLDAFLLTQNNQQKEIDKLKVDVEALKAWRFTSIGSVGLLVGLIAKYLFDKVTI